MSSRSRRKSKRLLRAESNPRTLVSATPETNTPLRNDSGDTSRRVKTRCSGTSGVHSQNTTSQDNQIQQDTDADHTCQRRENTRDANNDNDNTDNASDQGQNDGDQGENDEVSEPQDGDGSSSEGSESDVERGQFRGPHCIVLMTSLLDRQPHRAAHKQRLATWDQVRADVLGAFPSRKWATSTLRRKVNALVGLHEVSCASGAISYSANSSQKQDDTAWRKSRIHINQQDMIQLGALIDRYRDELEQVQRAKDQASTDKQNVRFSCSSNAIDTSS